MGDSKGQSFRTQPKKLFILFILLNCLFQNNKNSLTEQVIALPGFHIVTRPS